MFGWRKPSDASQLGERDGPTNFREIAELLSKGTKLKPTNADRARVVQRGLEKKAPFSTGRNSVADALLIRDVRHPNQEGWRG